jgi:hypothetical protein
LRKILLAVDSEELQDRPECQQCALSHRCGAAFEFALGTVRAFQIAFAVARGDDEDVDVDSRCNWLMNMAPYWLVRLNDLLSWLNPALGLVAAVLALLTIAAAAERFPGKAPSPAAYSPRPVHALASVECARPVLPPELRDLRLYD